MLLNRIVFLIKFGTCEHITKLYLMCGFEVRRVHMDGQFEGIQTKICWQNICINITYRE